MFKLQNFKVTLELVLQTISDHKKKNKIKQIEGKQQFFFLFKCMHSSHYIVWLLVP